MDILYQDNSILVCIKPAGVLSTDEPGGVPELVRQALGDPKACVRTVHRLDRVVSGLMVLARTPAAASKLSAQIREHDFGKTYLAVAEAVAAFRAKTVNRIILTRPAVEAGERLGFLPGDLQNKVDPYLRPLYDALFDMLGPETYGKYLERGNIEVAPLAYMRGRTLDDSFIILDEAQNTTREQMKMFLTRLGFGSKIVITGDITQIDLPGDKVSGLKEAIRVLDGVEDIQICRLTPADVVRHVLVQRIVAAYDKYEKNRLPDERARTFTRKPDWKREKK